MVKEIYANLIVGASAVGGAYVKSNVFSLGNNYYDIALGLGISFAGYYLKVNGVTDVLEGFGLGYALTSAIAEFI